MQVDFTRFHTYTGDELNTTPQWSDEFIGTTLDYGKWQVANWSFHETQFRSDNIKVQDGSLFLRVNRGGSHDWIPPAPSTPVVTQTLNVEPDGLDTTSPDTFVDTNTDVATDNAADTGTDTVADTGTNTVTATGTNTVTATGTDTVTDTGTDTVPTVDTSVVVADKDITSFEVSSTPTPDNTNEAQIGVGAFGWVYLLLLGGFLPLQRRLTPVN